MEKEIKTIEILGLPFFEGDVEDVVQTLKFGGLLVVPAAPGLINIEKDEVYFQSLLSADITIPDSGYMTGIWNLAHRRTIRKISGLKFLKAFLADKEVRNTSRILLVDPRLSEAASNLAYLKAKGFQVAEDQSYIAPVYNKNSVKDEVLLKLIEEKKPKYVIINLGGGVQEKLGAYLKNNLSYAPAIICTGAAIAFLTGKQASIPNWADRLSIGWLFRCINNPAQFVPRYLRAFALILLMFKRRTHRSTYHYFSKFLFKFNKSKKM